MDSYRSDPMTVGITANPDRLVGAYQSAPTGRRPELIQAASADPIVMTVYSRLKRISLISTG